jgi:diguanylate cyclase (GGDEF)-like protein
MKPQRCAPCLNMACAMQRFCARLGGDEFAVLLPEADENNAQLIVPRIQHALLAEMEKNDWAVTFSIGALTCQQTPPDNEELIRLADQLMYGVKNTSKDAIAYSVYAG